MWEITAGNAQSGWQSRGWIRSTGFNMVIIFKCTEISSHYVV